MDIAKERGIKRAVLLPVSAPFHCALMQPAADAMAQALGNAQIAPPRAPVVANVTAAPYPTQRRFAGFSSSRSPARCAGGKAWPTSRRPA